MEDVRNAMRREAERVGGRTAQTRMALVSSYDKDNYAVKVLLQPEGIETGWAPLAAMQVGGGWGLFAPPSIGDQVVVIHQEGDGGSPIVIGSLYSEQDRPVAEEIGGCPEGEFRIINKKGARIRLVEDGSIEIRKASGSLVRLNTDDSVDIFSPDIRAGGLGSTFRRLVNDAFQAIFNSHTHGNGPAPNQKMTEQHMTTNLKGA